MIDFDADLAALLRDPAIESVYTVQPKGGQAAYPLHGLLDLADEDALTGYAQTATPLLHYRHAEAPQLAVGDALTAPDGKRYTVRHTPRRVGDGRMAEAELGV